MASVRQNELSLSESRDESEMGNPIESKSEISSSLFDRVLERNNLTRALKQVQRNKGAAGIDGMTVDVLPNYLIQHWRGIKQKLLDGTYHPSAVLRVEISKPDGASVSSVFLLYWIDSYSRQYHR